MIRETLAGILTVSSLGCTLPVEETREEKVDTYTEIEDCLKPYVTIDDRCCIDSDYNGVCDENENYGKILLAQCLVDLGNVRIYGTDWCPPCQWEKNEFGPAWSIIAENIYTDCTEEEGVNQHCKDLGIYEFPYFDFDIFSTDETTKHAGAIQLYQFSQFTPCVYDENAIPEK